MIDGISAVVCTHNGAARIGKTLEHLARQEGLNVPWEVIVVDNGSTDDTAAVARESWPSDSLAPLRVLSESAPGYNNAIECGIANVRTNIVAQVHDDNWLAKDWLATAVDIFKDDPDLGACGGMIKETLETAPPFWFKRFKEDYAVGAQAAHSGDVTWSRGYLWGAGLCVRKQAWTELKQQGFKFLSTGRGRSHRLVSGEDSELCYALRLAGWKLFYSDKLTLTHFLPSSRLQWKYLRRLSRSFGEASVLHDCYRSAVGEGPGKTWSMALIESLDNLLTLNRAWFSFPRDEEGDGEILLLERAIGRTLQLLRMGGAYNRAHRMVLQAPWRRISCARSEPA